MRRAIMVLLAAGAITGYAVGFRQLCHGGGWSHGGWSHGGGEGCPMQGEAQGDQGRDK